MGHSFGYDAASCPGCSALAFGAGLSDQAALSDVLSGKRGLRVDAASAALSAAKLSRDDADRTLRVVLEQAQHHFGMPRSVLRYSVGLPEPLYPPHVESN